MIGNVDPHNNRSGAVSDIPSPILSYKIKVRVVKLREMAGTLLLVEAVTVYYRDLKKLPSFP